jgi:hypothetical protein
MTTDYDVERTITSLGIGEALVTVLSPKGIPTPLAATRLIPPDSRMAPLNPQELAQVIAASPLNAKYGTTVDPQSAHEIITARLAAAHAAVAQAAQAAVPGGGFGTAAAPAPTARDAQNAALGGMTPAQYRAELQRQVRAQEVERKAEERDRKAQEREAKVAERARQRTINTTVRTVGRVATSRLGQSLIRGVFGTIFGGKG